MNTRFLLATLAAVVTATAAIAQPRPQDGARGGMMMPQQRTIQVTGTSEMEVTPDQICVTVQLHEYAEPAEGEKKSPSTVSLETIEQDFYKQLESMGISKNDVTASDVTFAPFRATRQRIDAARRFDRPAPRKEMSRPDSANAPKRRFDGKPLPRRQARAYEITLTSFDDIDKIKKSLDKRALGNVRIKEMTSSKINEYRQQARIAALADATTGAKSLVEAAGGELGNVMNIVVVPEHGRNDADRDKGVIKLHSAVTVTFAIK